MLVLGSLSVSSIAVMLHTLMAATPLPAPLNPGPAARAIQGYRLEPLPGTGSKAGRRLSHSGVRRFAVQPDGGGMPLQLTLVNLHSRTHHNFQLAALTRGADAPPGLALENRRLLPGPVTTAIGTLATAAGQDRVTALQSCLVPDPDRRRGEAVRGGVSRDELNGLFNNRADRSTAPLRVLQEALHELGPRSELRWQCLLVSVSTPAEGRAAETALRRFFNRAASSLVKLVSPHP